MEYLESRVKRAFQDCDDHCLAFCNRNVVSQVDCPSLDCERQLLEFRAIAFRSFRQVAVDGARETEELNAHSVGCGFKHRKLSNSSNLYFSVLQPGKWLNMWMLSVREIGREGP